MKIEVSPNNVKFLFAKDEEQGLDELQKDCISSMTTYHAGFDNDTQRKYILIPFDQSDKPETFENGDMVVVEKTDLCSKLFHGHTGEVSFPEGEDITYMGGIPVYLLVEADDPKKSRYIFHPKALKKI